MIRAVYRPRKRDLLLIAADGTAVLPVPLAEAADLGTALIAAAGTPAHVAKLLTQSTNATGDPI